MLCETLTSQPADRLLGNESAAAPNTSVLQHAHVFVDETSDGTAFNVEVNFWVNHHKVSSCGGANANSNLNGELGIMVLLVRDTGEPVACFSYSVTTGTLSTQPAQFSDNATTIAKDPQQPQGSDEDERCGGCIQLCSPPVGHSPAHHCAAILWRL